MKRAKQATFLALVAYVIWLKRTPGPVGPQGPPGYQGPMGNTGPAGPPGVPLSGRLHVTKW